MRDATYRLDRFAEIAGADSLDALERDWHAALVRWCSLPRANRIPQSPLPEFRVLVTDPLAPPAGPTPTPDGRPTPPDFDRTAEVLREVEFAGMAALGDAVRAGFDPISECEAPGDYRPKQ